MLVFFLTFLTLAALALFVAVANCDLLTAFNPHYESSTAKAVFAGLLALHWLIKAGDQWPAGGE